MRVAAILRFCAIIVSIAGLQTGSVNDVSALSIHKNVADNSAECISYGSCIYKAASKNFNLPTRPPPQPNNFRSQFNQRASGILNQGSVLTGQNRQQTQSAYIKKIILPTTVVRNLQATARIASIQTPPGRAKSMPAVLAQAATLKGLARHERQGLGQGGHTIAFHVGLTDDEIKNRLSNPTKFNSQQTKLQSVSSFSSGAIATRAIAATMWGRKADIKKWLNSNPSVGDRSSFEMSQSDRAKIGITGRGIGVGDSNVRDRSGAKVILQYQGFGKYIIYTAHPEN